MTGARIFDARDVQAQTKVEGRDAGSGQSATVTTMQRGASFARLPRVGIVTLSLVCASSGLIHVKRRARSACNFSHRWV